MVKTLKEAEDRIREAMKPQTAGAGQGLSPAIQKMRASAGRARPTPPRQRRPTPARRPLPMAR